MNPILHFYSSLHFHVYYLIWCSSQSSKEDRFCFVLFFSQTSNFLAARGRKGYSTELAFFFLTTFHIRLFLQPGWVKPEAGVLLFLDCYQHLTPSAVLLHQSLQGPTPATTAGLCHEPAHPRTRLLQLRARTTHPAPRGCAPGTPPHPQHSSRPVWTSQSPRMSHSGKTQLPGNSRPDFLEGWSSRLSLGRGLGDFCVPSDPEVLGDWGGPRPRASLVALTPRAATHQPQRSAARLCRSLRPPGPLTQLGPRVDVVHAH